MVINAPSLANINYMQFEEQVKQLVEGGVRFFHVDIMDGHYVPNLCFPPTVVRDLKEKYLECTVEVHLMVDDPISYLEKLKEYGADYVSFHEDSTNFVIRTLMAIKKLGMKAGVVLNPSQNISVIQPFAELLDYLVFMSVEPGIAGQKFLPGSLERLKELSLFRKRQGLSFQILVDGGVDSVVMEDCVKNGADMLVTGIYVVFNQPDGIVKACGRFNEKMKDIRSEI